MKYKKAAGLAVFTAVAYLALKLTTVGWYFWSPAYHGGRTATSAEELKRTVTDLAVNIGPRDLYNNNKTRLRRAEEYLRTRFRAAGCELEEQEYYASGVKVRNFICTRKGAVSPGEIVLVGAHYDTFNNPGADDNASGVAGVLELAGHAAGRSYERTVRFAAFANEEPPFFRHEGMGSAVYAAAARKSGDDIRAAVILEMTGYYSERPLSQRYPPLIGPFMPSKGNFIAQISDFGSRAEARTIDRAFRKASGLPLQTVSLPAWVPGVDFSDHRSFWAQGYPAVMFTDTSFYRTPHYHKPTDLPDTLDYGRMAALQDGLKAALDALAGAAGPGMGLKTVSASPAGSPASSRRGPL